MSKRFNRTPDTPYVLPLAKAGEPFKHCNPCDRDIAFNIIDEMIRKFTAEQVVKQGE